MDYLCLLKAISYTIVGIASFIGIIYMFGIIFNLIYYRELEFNFKDNMEGGAVMFGVLLVLLLILSVVWLVYTEIC